MVDADDVEWEDDFKPWTPEGAERVLLAGEQLAAAIKTHAEAIASTHGPRHASIIVEAGDALLPLVFAYADATFEYTGHGSPFGPLRQFYEDEEEDEYHEDREDVDERPTSGFTVLQGRDYGVLDEASVLAAGRAAYLRVWPDDTEEDAAADVNHLGRALYQIAHAGGWDSLNRIEALRPVGGVTQVVEHAELLGPDPEQWPVDTFAVEGATIYRLSESWS